MEKATEEEDIMDVLISLEDPFDPIAREVGKLESPLIPVHEM